MADDFRSLRSARFREITAGSGYRAALGAAVVAGVGGLILGNVATGGFMLLALAGGVGAGALLVWAWTSATSHAEDSVLAAWGARHGLAFVERPSVAQSTPFLRRGDRRTFANGLIGEIGGCPGSLVCHYTVITKHRDSKGDESESSTEYTIAVLPMEDAVARALPGLAVTRRGITGGLFDGLSSAITSARVVELESAVLHDRYRIAVRDETSDIVVRRLFEPAFMVWLEDSAGRDLEFELESGHLVIWRDGRLRDPAALDPLVADAEHLAERLRAAPEHSTTREEHQA